MEERRWTMDRKKFGAVLVTLMTGAALSVGSAWALAPAEITGYLMGDAAPGKLIPYYKVGPTLATIIGIENAEEEATLSGLITGAPGRGEDVSVHVAVFNKSSVELLNFDLCLSPLDFGYLVLQKAAPSALQIADLNKVTGPFTRRRDKARVLSFDSGDIASEGYVSVRAVNEFFTHDGTCGQGFSDFEETIPDGVAEPLATWAILADVGSGFFATEIPTPTAVVGDFGDVFGGSGAYGLIPAQNVVFARFDVNPTVGSHTDIYVWLANNKGSRTALLDCEDQLEISTVIDLSHEVNIIDPDTLGGISQCKDDGQYRGVLRFSLPDTGFLWSHISQDDAHFRQNYLGYNLQCNTFIDPSCDDPD